MRLQRRNITRRHSRRHIRRGGASARQKGIAAQMRDATYILPDAYDRRYELGNIIHSSDLNPRKNNRYTDITNKHDPLAEQIIQDTWQKIQAGIQTVPNQELKNRLLNYTMENDDYIPSPIQNTTPYIPPHKRGMSPYTPSTFASIDSPSTTTRTYVPKTVIYKPPIEKMPTPPRDSPISSRSTPLTPPTPYDSPFEEVIKTPTPPTLHDSLVEEVIKTPTPPTPYDSPVQEAIKNPTMETPKTPTPSLSLPPQKSKSPEKSKKSKKSEKSKKKTKKNQEKAKLEADKEDEFAFLNESANEVDEFHHLLRSIMEPYNTNKKIEEFNPENLEESYIRSIPELHDLVVRVANSTDTVGWVSKNTLKFGFIYKFNNKYNMTSFKFTQNDSIIKTAFNSYFDVDDINTKDPVDMILYFPVGKINNTTIFTTVKNVAIITTLLSRNYLFYGDAIKLNSTKYVKTADYFDYTRRGNKSKIVNMNCILIDNIKIVNESEFTENIPKSPDDGMYFQDNTMYFVP